MLQLLYLEVPATHRGQQEQLESTVWVTDPDVVYRLAKVVEDKGDKLVIGFRDENGFYEKIVDYLQRTVYKKDTHPPSVSYYCEDMCNLTELDEASVLNTVRCRYEAQLIHTYSGLFCVVVNPWKNLPIYTDDVKEAYGSAVGSEGGLPPHVYSVAQSAYDGLASCGNQSILITGESGAGKTENTKKILDYLGCRASRCNGFNDVQMDERLAAANLLIESFANASTIHNSNSSRIGKFIRMYFNDELHLNGAQIQCCRQLLIYPIKCYNQLTITDLLEKSRVVSQNDGDRNFHIFYQMLSNGFDDEIRKQIGLTKKAKQYRFLNQGGKVLDSNIDDSSDSVATDKALRLIGFTSKERQEIYEIVASCLLLGEIKFNERSGLDITYVDGDKGKYLLFFYYFQITTNSNGSLICLEVEAACRILGVKTTPLIDALTQPSIRVGDMSIKKSQNLKKTLSSLAALCKCIYERLFKWILQRCNEALGQFSRIDMSARSHYIGVLDMAGFEIMQKNSFEQFCINYTNEKLQQFFNDFMFIKEQHEYLREGIDWKEVSYGTDMQNTIELIEKPLGLLSLLQEECLVPNGSDMALLEKLITNHSSNPVFARSKHTARSVSSAHFTVAHYAGIVSYNIDGWVEKNKDAVEKSGLDVLAASTKTVMQQLFSHSDDEMPRGRRQSMCTNTVSYVYKEQLLALLETLNTTRAQFIRCISPNKNRQPGVIDNKLVIEQLRCNGVLEGIRICRQGYPNRLPFEDFVLRYRFITPQLELEPNRQGAQQLCAELGLDESIIQIGNTKIFCKVGVITQVCFQLATALETRRRQRLNAIITNIQAYICWYLEQIKLKRMIEKRKAILIIQRNVRTFAEIANWKWCSLLNLVRQLIPMERDKKRIEELEEENEQLIKELDKADDKCSELEILLGDATRVIENLKKEKREYESKKDEMKAEIQKHEEVMEIMERRFDEQHVKVMKIHAALRENEKRMQTLEEEKADMEKELYKWKGKYETEYSRRLDFEREHEKDNETICMLEQQITNINAEQEKEAARTKALHKEIAELKERSDKQLETIRELQNNLCEMNEKTKECDSLVNAEKRARKKAEAEKLDKQEEIGRLQQDLHKITVKAETLKENCHEKDREIRRLEGKLSSAIENAENNIAEMKKIHKKTREDLVEKIEELKKTCHKLEAENRSQKVKLNASERESSVESDYGTPFQIIFIFVLILSERSSRLGSRQLSFSSMGSFSSIRTLSSSLRRTTEPEIRSLSRWRTPSTLSASYHSCVRTESTPSPLSKSISQSHISYERKIAQLERQVLNAHTDNQLQKREIEVYKTSLASHEKEKETLKQKVRTLNAEISVMERSLNDEENRSHEYEMKLRKAHTELQSMKNKYEQVLQDSQKEILDERLICLKKMRQKVEELTKELEQKRARDGKSMEATMEELQAQLTDAHSQLDRAVNQINHLENLSKSQGIYGETWENQYRSAFSELQSLRDENAVLKTKINRQNRQIELLTQQSELDDNVAQLESMLQRQRRDSQAVSEYDNGQDSVCDEAYDSGNSSNSPLQPPTCTAV
uniref:Myosin motor domain-containing protein n=1 Tax=Syphacia muris TaxID=451379 RepID=A0A0N5AVT7_9BILA